MTTDSQFNLELSRRKLFTEAGIAGGAVVAASVVGSVAAQAMNTPAPSTHRAAQRPHPTR